MEKIEFKVMGMSCGHCERAIINALEDIGVVATADKDSGTVVAEFDPAEITVEAIRKEIEEAGYNVI